MKSNFKRKICNIFNDYSLVLNETYIPFLIYGMPYPYIDIDKTGMAN